jgi:hypothetical protein
MLGFAKTLSIRARLAAAAVAGLIALVPSTVTVTKAQVPPVRLPAHEVDFLPQIETLEYPTITPAGKPTGNASWRVVKATGNCCENYLLATPQGRLLDLGGTYARFTDDKGLTWKEVRPLEPLVNGEGGLSYAPNGDIVAMTWDPYSGDHIVTFKYEAAEKTWYSSETKLHTPFYDRPWHGLIKGPFEIGGQIYPYISVIMSNFLVGRELYMVSTDGLNYFIPNARWVERRLGVVQKLRMKNDPWVDYGQPQVESGLTPLPGGGALAADHVGLNLGQAEVRAFLKPPRFKWSDYEMPAQTGHILADSRTRLHLVDAPIGSKSFTFKTSPDGGGKWESLKTQLPAGFVVEDMDFKVNGALGIGAVAIHAHHMKKNVDQDFVYRMDIRKAVPKIDRIFTVGAGDQSVSSGAGADLRFDFATIAILPDGTIATSFVDSNHLEPSLAVLVSEPAR